MTTTPTQPAGAGDDAALPELLPCPFCGADPDIKPWHGGGPDQHLVSCRSDEYDCEVLPSVTGETRELAIAAWNRRTPLAAQSAPAEPQPDPREAPAQPVPAGKLVADECAATGAGHSYGPHGPHGERQCQYCGEPPAAPADDAAALRKALEFAEHMAAQAERLLAAIGAEDELCVRRAESDDVDDDEMADARQSRGTAMRGLRAGVDAFRGASASAPPPAASSRYLRDLEDTLAQLASAAGLDPTRPDADALLARVRAMAAAAPAQAPSDDDLKRLLIKLACVLADDKPMVVPLSRYREGVTLLRALLARYGGAVPAVPTGWRVERTKLYQDASVPALNITESSVGTTLVSPIDQHPRDVLYRLADALLTAAEGRQS